MVASQRAERKHNAMYQSEMLAQLKAGNVQAVIAALEELEEAYMQHLEEEEQRYKDMRAMAEDAELVF